MATIEALASGTPVVGTPVGATPELLAPLDARLLAPGTSAADLDDAIRAGLALLTPELRERCRAARARAALVGVGDPGLGGRARGCRGRRAAAAAQGRRRSGGKALDRHAPIDLKATRDGLVAQDEGDDRACRRVRAGCRARPGGSAPTRRAGILLYHNPDAATLDRHLAYLAERHRFVSVRAQSPTPCERATGRTVPPRSLALTFDDGHADNAALLPVLDRYGAHATIFICTGIVGTTRRYWWTLDELGAKERDRLMNVPQHERLARLDELAGWTPEREYEETAAGAVDGADRRPRRPRRRSRRTPACTRSSRRAIPPRRRPRSKARRRTWSASPGSRARPSPTRTAATARASSSSSASAGFDSARTIETGWNDPDTDPVPAARARDARQCLPQCRRRPEHRPAVSPRPDVPLMSERLSCRHSPGGGQGE